MRRIGFIVLLGTALTSGLQADSKLPAPTPSTTVPGMGGKELCKQNFDEYRDRIKQNSSDSEAWQELRVCSDLLKRWGEAGCRMLNARKKFRRAPFSGSRGCRAQGNRP